MRVACGPYTWTECKLIGEELAALVLSKSAQLVILQILKPSAEHTVHVKVRGYT